MANGGRLSRPAAPNQTAALATFILTAVCGVGLSAQVAGGSGVLGERWHLLARLAAWGVVWAVGVVSALRLPRRTAVVAVLLAAAAIRLAALAGPPAISDDLFRYAWDGHVQAAGVDPYRYPPSASELADLRDSWLWPDRTGCVALHRPPECTRINRSGARTIYPPAAEAWFAVVYRLGGGLDLRHRLWQVAGLVSDLTLVATLPLVLRSRGRDPRWCALYALSPVAVVEVVNNAHVDGLAALFAVLALWTAAKRRRGAGAGPGVLLGVATLVKLYPALLVAGLADSHRSTAAQPSRWRPAPRRRSASRWRRPSPWHWRWPPLAQSLAALIITVAVGYLPHVLAVGPHVLGYLPGYLQEERYSEGGRFLLVAAITHWRAPTLAAAILLLAGLHLIAVRHRTVPDPAEAMALLLGGALLVATPVQPWYSVTLLAVATVAARPAWGLVAAAGYPYYFAVVLDHPHPVLIGRVSYGLALAAVVMLEVRWRRMRVTSLSRTGGEVPESGRGETVEPTITIRGTRIVGAPVSPSEPDPLS